MPTKTASLFSRHFGNASDSLDHTVDRLQALKDRLEPDRVINYGILASSMSFVDSHLYYSGLTMLSGFRPNTLRKPLFEKLLNPDAPQGERFRVYSLTPNLQMKDVCPGGMLQQKYQSIYTALIAFNTQDVVNAAIALVKESGDAEQAKTFCDIMERTMRIGGSDPITQGYQKVPYADEPGIQLEMDLGGPVAAL